MGAAYGAIRTATNNQEDTAMNKETPLATIRGFEVFLDRDFDFRVKGLPAENGYGDSTFASMQAAKEAINKHHDSELALAKKNIACNLDVVDKDGNPMIVTGLHRGTRAALVKGGQPFHGELYPNDPEVVSRLKRYDEAQREASELREWLHHAKIDDVGGRHGTAIRPERYAKVIEILVERDVKARINVKSQLELGRPLKHGESV